ncbi:hypothetical protein [Dactylosporangium cerinum]
MIEVAGRLSAQPVHDFDHHHTVLVDVTTAVLVHVAGLATIPGAAARRRPG